MDEAGPPEGLQVPTAAMIEGVDVLRAGLRDLGLDVLAAKLSEAFWSMGPDGRDALLGEVSAELRRVGLASEPGHASVPNVSPDPGAPVSFHYFDELEEGVGATWFASAGHLLFNNEAADVQSRVPERHRGTSAAAGVTFDRTPWIVFSGETKAVEDWLSLHQTNPAAPRDSDPLDTVHAPRSTGEPWICPSTLVHELPHAWPGSTTSSRGTSEMQDADRARGAKRS